MKAKLLDDHNEKKEMLRFHRYVPAAPMIVPSFR